MSRPERTPLQLAQSTINLLNLLLFCKIFLLVTSLSFIFVALKDLKEDQMGTKHVALRDRTFLLQNGLYVGCVSLVSGLQLLSNSPNLSILRCVFCNNRSCKCPGSSGIEALATSTAGTLTFYSSFDFTFYKVPYLACLVFGAMYSLCYILEAIFIFGVKVNEGHVFGWRQCYLFRTLP